MPQTFRFTLIAAAVATALTTGCATTPTPAEPQAAADDRVLVDAAPAPLPSPEAQMQFHVMAGEMAAARQQPGEAAAHFLAALETSDDVELARRATGLALAAEDYDLALKAAQKWLQLEPNSADPREVITIVMLNRGELAGTLEQCLEIVRGNAAGVAEGMRHAAQLLARAPADHGDLAQVVMQKLIDQWPDEAGSYYAQGILAVRYGQLELAERAARRALELAPKEREYAMLLVGVAVKQGRYDEADARVAELTRGNKDAAAVHTGYARLLLDAQQTDRAKRELEAVVKLRPTDADAHLALGLLAASENDVKTAQRHLKPLLGGERGPEAAMQLGRMAEEQQHYQEALGYYSRISSGPMVIDAAVRRAVALSKLGRIDESRELLAQLRDRYPQYALRFLLTEGELLTTQRRLDDAMSLYDSALEVDPGNGDLLYGRSLVHEQKGQIDLAEKDLRSILADTPDDTRALNALGYMLVVHTDRLSEAHDLISKALEQDPEDAAILDSMGWLYFKQGQASDALPLLEKAYAQFPDPEVAAHLGEVLWTLGERAKARSVLDAALAKNPEHATLRETSRRLKQ
ncbi:tetratricopeptide repeat protein [Sinimarinibacterium sp. CAU 1509]|uniref:tetratricopeptide repeat protein n=1 Tax=Sinimarinibacterium sp. CAU 1509 TaxID=2562283 RepID=UPI0010ABF5F7|nr:tetratricopeptide repeat protein [Sinimarinibacterium sp. CAU 1509]TJY61872.1 tetratricopeptide repeat protein [Sinimarinibacterium sp. CAU 1509]